MTPTRHPLIDLVYNDETGRYIGMLERKLVIMTTENLKMRALLELLTGDMWDDKQFSAEDEEIKGLAIDTLKKPLNLSHDDATNMVDERWKATNPPEPDESAKTWLVGQPRKTPHVVTYSRPIGTPAGVDMKKHLAGIKQSRDHMRDQL